MKTSGHSGGGSDRRRVFELQHTNNSKTRLSKVKENTKKEPGLLVNLQKVN